MNAGNGDETILSVRKRGVRNENYVTLSVLL